MPVREYIVKIRMTKEEYRCLKDKAQKAGMTAAAFIRMAIAGAEIHEAPPVDVPFLIREVRCVGNNIAQILRIANTKGLLVVPDLRKALEQNRAVEKLIAGAYG